MVVGAVEPEIDCGPKMAHSWPMKTILVSKAKGQLGKLVRLAHAGQPTIISTGGIAAKIVALDVPGHGLVAPPGAFADLYKNNPDIEEENKRCRAMGKTKLERS